MFAVIEIRSEARGGHFVVRLLASSEREARAMLDAYTVPVVLGIVGDDVKIGDTVRALGFHNVFEHRSRTQKAVL